MNRSGPYPARCLSVIVPVYNKAKTVESVILKVPERPEVAEFLVDDDASNDGTWRILQEEANRLNISDSVTQVSNSDLSLQTSLSLFR